jgi:hypothetical protein
MRIVLLHNQYLYILFCILLKTKLNNNQKVTTMKTKITLHIYAKATKANAIGQLPIYIRLTIAGQRLEFSTKKFVDPAKWSSDASKMKGSSEEACSINNYLDMVRSKIFDTQMDLAHKN